MLAEMIKNYKPKVIMSFNRDHLDEARCTFNSLDFAKIMGVTNKGSEYLGSYISHFDFYSISTIPRIRRWTTKSKRIIHWANKLQKSSVWSTRASSLRSRSEKAKHLHLHKTFDILNISFISSIHKIVLSENNWWFLFLLNTFPFKKEKADLETTKLLIRVHVCGNSEQPHFLWFICSDTRMIFRFLYDKNCFSILCNHRHQ